MQAKDVIERIESATKPGGINEVSTKRTGELLLLLADANAHIRQLQKRLKMDSLDYELIQWDTIDFLECDKDMLECALESYREENAKLKEALQFYGNENNWGLRPETENDNIRILCDLILMDGGKIAREALNGKGV